MQTANRIKVVFKNETKKFKKPETYDILLKLTQKAFGSTLPPQFKFFYQDVEGDIISISCQEDLEEAYESMSSLKLVIDESSESARFNMDPDCSMRSSINVPMMMNGMGGFVQTGGVPQSNRVNSSFYFEDMKQGQPQLVMRTVDTHMMTNQELQTEQKNLVNVSNFGCGTNIQTVEKEMNTKVDTNEMGSQIAKEVKEVYCDGSIQTDSKGSQMRVEGKEQEVNCQIIRPEVEEEQINEEDNTLVCFKCDGTQINKKGLPCRRCNGTGKLQGVFFKGLVKVLQEEVKSFTTQTFQRMIGDYISKKAQEQSQQLHQSIVCDGCQVSPIQGIRYKCSVCPDFDFCEKCESTKAHPHPFLKVRKAEQAPAFIRCSYDKIDVKESSNKQSHCNMKDSSIKRKDGGKMIIYNARFVKENFGDRYKVAPKQNFMKSWTFRNTGDREWPQDTLFIQTNGDNLEALTQMINGPVKPNDEITIQMEMMAPELPGKYCAFFRFVHGDNQRFGQKVWCDILVEAPLIEMIKPQVVDVSSSLMDESSFEQKSSSLLDQQPNFENNHAIQMVNQQEQEVNIEMKEPIVLEEEPKQEIVKEEAKVDEPKLSDEEILKRMYTEELQNSGIKDENLVNNLKYMMNMGYLNYKVNYNLLVRNNNDLIIAVNKLCNNIVTDTMFEIKQ